ncbi:S-layer homology domain-containing protein [Paenibacillus hamazuiensis]|uniref:S-layer homology domain-containing protein n=1 Tax=Paenibacillus hamazuiensis TaxID=2936508 RepID=UPI00200E3E52|nr:S-layer homology domain-containing protein [Paenibacillus hamazuiensis]
MKKWFMLMLTLLLAVSAFGGTVWAFSDLDNVDGKEKIASLQSRGIVSGVDGEHFQPRGKVSYAQAVHMVVKGLKLNIDNIKFIKEPKASDYFTSVPDDAWYAQSFIIAQLNGLPLAKDVNPNAVITREQFADLLMQAVLKTGDYAFVKMLMVYADEDEVDPAYKNSIQLLLLGKIASLDKDRRFYPKQELTRGTAAVWLHDAIKFVESHGGKGSAPEEPSQQEQVAVTVEKVNDDVNKVTLSWGQKPNPGYAVQIAGIDFTDAGIAEIRYTLSYPDPDKSYAAVITEPKADTYVSSKYQAVAKLVK